MATRTLKIPTECPQTALDHERCATCLREQLRRTPGVRNVTLHPANGNPEATLELDYDPRLISMNQLDSELHRAGACFSPNRAELVLGIDGMVSQRSEQSIEAHLAKLPGVVAT